MLDGAWVGQRLITDLLAPDAGARDVADYEKSPGLSVHEFKGVARPGHQADVLVGRLGRQRHSKVGESLVVDEMGEQRRGFPFARRLWIGVARPDTYATCAK